MYKKLISLICCLIAMALFAGGCMGATALDRYSYVTSLGIDKGSVSKYNITLQIQHDGQNGTSLEGAGADLISVEADTLFEAISIADASFPYLLDFSKVNSFVISQEAAKSDFCSVLFSTSLNALGIRESARLMVTECKASDYYKGQDLSINPNIAKFQSNIIESSVKDGTTVIMNIAMFMEGISSGCYDPVLALGRVDKSAAQVNGSNKMSITGSENEKSGDESGEEKKADYTTDGIERSGGMATYILGCAVFDGTVLAGVLSCEDAKLLNIMRGNMTSCSMTYSINDNEYVFSISQDCAPDVAIGVYPSPNAHMKIMLHGDAQYSPDMRSGVTINKEVIAGLENYIEESLELLAKKLKDLNSDAAGFGRYACMKFIDTNEWENYNWKEKYKHLEVSFEVEVKFADMDTK